jgi:hypothetical protein
MLPQPSISGKSIPARHQMQGARAGFTHARIGPAAIPQMGDINLQGRR